MKNYVTKFSFLVTKNEMLQMNGEIDENNFKTLENNLKFTRFPNKFVFKNEMLCEFDKAIQLCLKEKMGDLTIGNFIYSIEAVNSTFEEFEISLSANLRYNRISEENAEEGSYLIEVVDMPNNIQYKLNGLLGIYAFHCA